MSGLTRPFTYMKIFDLKYSKQFLQLNLSQPFTESRPYKISVDFLTCTCENILESSVQTVRYILFLTNITIYHGIHLTKWKPTCKNVYFSVVVLCYLAIAAELMSYVEV